MSKQIFTTSSQVRLPNIFSQNRPLVLFVFFVDIFPNLCKKHNSNMSTKIQTSEKRDSIANNLSAEDGSGKFHNNK